MPFLNDITLGQYYPTESYIHRLDPRTKILVILGIMTVLLIIHGVFKLAATFLVILFIIRVSQVPFLLVIRNLRPFLWLFLLTPCWLKTLMNSALTSLTGPMMVYHD